MKLSFDCGETFRRLDDYLDRELSHEETIAVEAHLAGCERCAGEFVTERELLEGIKAKLSRLRVPDRLKSRIAALLSSP